MRKLLMVMILIIISFFIWLYFFIPAQLNMEARISIDLNQNSVNRGLNDTGLWKRWWPGTSGHELSYNNFKFQPQLPGLFAYAVNVADNTDNYKTVLSIVETGRHAVFLSWKGTISTGNNPFIRITRYLKVKQLNGIMANILLAAKQFLSEPKNIYGINITNELVKDTLLLNTHCVLNDTPTTNEIYAVINKLEKAASDGGAAITGHPMMNLTENADSGYLLRVALPVSKPVKEINGVVVKRMVPGNILVSNDITGGSGTVAEAFRQMMNYARDIGKTLPAIPFQSLITNRQNEKDSTKWKTRIYCPVI